MIADRDRVALQRGPIVYAAEWPDNPNGKVRNIVLPDGNTLTSEFRRDLLNGVQVIRGRAVGLAFDEKGGVQKAEQPFMAIPYATWANRGRGQMAVWLARTDAAARPTPYPTLATTSTMAASPLPNGRGKNPRNMIDGDEPASSADSSAYFDWWPVQGSKSEWIEMTFAQAGDRVRDRGLLVRRHRPRRRPRARVLAAALQERRPVAPVEATTGVRRRAQRLEHASVHAGDDHGAADRGRDAGEVLRRRPGMKIK